MTSKEAGEELQRRPRRPKPLWQLLVRAEPRRRRYTLPRVEAIEPGEQHTARIELPARNEPPARAHDDESFDVEVLTFSLVPPESRSG